MHDAWTWTYKFAVIVHLLMIGTASTTIAYQEKLDVKLCRKWPRLADKYSTVEKSETTLIPKSANVPRILPTDIKHLY